jgi:hypothetical protein
MIYDMMPNPVTHPTDTSDFVVSCDGEAELIETKAGRWWKRKGRIVIELDDPNIYSVRAMTPAARRWLRKHGIRAVQPRGDSAEREPDHDALAIITPLDTDTVQTLAMRLLQCGFVVNGFNKSSDDVRVTLN